MTNPDGNLAAQIGVSGPIHLPHAAFAKQGGDFVRAESRTSGQGHVDVKPGGFYK